MFTKYVLRVKQNTLKKNIPIIRKKSVVSSITKLNFKNDLIVCLLTNAVCKYRVQVWPISRYRSITFFSWNPCLFHMVFFNTTTVSTVIKLHPPLTTEIWPLSSWSSVRLLLLHQLLKNKSYKSYSVYTSWIRSTLYWCLNICMFEVT